VSFLYMKHPLFARYIAIRIPLRIAYEMSKFCVSTGSLSSSSKEKLLRFEEYIIDGLSTY